MFEENSNGVSRRGLLAKGAAVAAVLAGGSALGQATRQRPAGAAAAARAGGGMVPGRGRMRTRIGLQLYSVREDCGKDLPGVLKAVAAMGYQEVEFAGYYGRTAEQLKKMLDDNGLMCCGTHTGLDTLLGDNLAKTIEFNKTIGNRYLIVPSLPGKYTGSHQAWLDTAKLFNELAEKVKGAEMQVGYHNHSAEFKPIDGKMPWDTFMSNTSEDVIMQLDTGNCWHGGADPLPFLYKYPGRATTVHLKEYSKTDSKAVVGEGDMPWRAFFALCRAVGGTQWYIVEHEQYAAPPLECVKACIDNLREMGLIGMGGRGGTSRTRTTTGTRPSRNQQ